MWLTGYPPKYKIPLLLKAGEQSREDSPVGVEVNFSQALAHLEEGGTFDPNSVRLIELGSDGSLKGGVPVQFDREKEFDAASHAVGKVSWILKGCTPPYDKRSYELYFDILENGQKELACDPSGVTFHRLMEWGHEWDRAIDIEVGGGLFAVYNYGHQHSHLYKPFFHPVLGPSGKSITQNREYPGTFKGHYWHQGLFVAHGWVNDASFWEEREYEEGQRTGPWHNCGRILHQEFTELIEGPVYGRFTERNLWRKPDGVDLLEEHRRVTIYNLPADCRIIDFQIGLVALGQEVTFGTRPYNLLACRFSDAMNVEKDAWRYNPQMHADFEGPPRCGGMVLSSEGDINVAGLHQGLGRSAKWMDHSGPNGPEWEGMAMFDNPNNERYPTWWLNWNNMTMGPSFSYNEPYTLASDGTLVLNYRLYIHGGDAWMGRVAQRFDDYANPVNITVGHAEGVAVS